MTLTDLFGLRWSGLFSGREREVERPRRVRQDDDGGFTGRFRHRWGGDQEEFATQGLGRAADFEIARDPSFWDWYPRYRTQVNDVMFRGSELQSRDYGALVRQGIRGVVDLTAEGERDPVEAPRYGLRLLKLDIEDNTPPTMRQMVQFLDFATAPENQPFYVHCRAGVGRTGVAVAVYRMAVEGWSAQRAIAEANAFGMDVSGQRQFIRAFRAALDEGRIPGYPVR